MTVLTQKYQIGSSMVATGENPLPPQSFASDRIQAQLPNLHEVLAGLPFLSHETALLGVCEDGIPLLLDLRNPSPGALLVIAAQTSTSSEMLDVICQSLQVANAPFSLQIFRVTDTKTPSLHPLERVINPFERDLETRLLELADLSDSRQHGRWNGPSVVLMIDKLEWILQIDHEAIWAFEHLLHYGPAQKIWPIVATTTETETHLLRWLRRFRTLIWGADLSPAQKKHFGVPENPLSQFLPQTRCFSLRSQGQWIHLWLPEIARMR